ncbi:hypothetical protein ACZ90_36650 [Streptomyces albus subsp. albus]|nr:hypothetical protein ACZ90_36650 [Streptomyces albus subsp. albus]
MGEVLVPAVQAPSAACSLAGGFDEVAVEVHTSVFTDPAMLSLLARLAEPACASGAVDRDQADQWLAEQCRRAEAGRFLVAIPFFLASASVGSD